MLFEEADFDKVELESVDSIAIQEFVDVSDINPIFFDKPYYIEIIGLSDEQVPPPLCRVDEIPGSRHHGGGIQCISG